MFAPQQYSEELMLQNLEEFLDLNYGQTDARKENSLQSDNWCTPQQCIPQASFPYYTEKTNTINQIFETSNLTHLPIDRHAPEKFYEPNSNPSMADFLSTCRRPTDTHQNLVSKLPHKTKRFRTAFTTEQTEYLEELYKKKAYVTKTDRDVISRCLGITDKAIIVWFQNRRMKTKAMIKEASDFENYIDYIENKINRCQVINEHVYMPQDLYHEIASVISYILPSDVSLDISDNNPAISKATSPSLDSEVSSGNVPIYEPISPAPEGNISDERLQVIYKEIFG